MSALDGATRAYRDLEVVLPKVIEAYKVMSTLCESGAGSTDSAASGYCTAS